MPNEKKASLLSRAIETIPNNDFLVKILSLSLGMMVSTEKRSQLPNAEYRHERNPDYQPIGELIAQTIDHFRVTHPELPLTWSKDQQNYLSLEKLTQKLAEPISPEIKARFFGYKDKEMTNLEALRLLPKKGERRYFYILLEDILGNQLGFKKLEEAVSVDRGGIETTSVEQYTQLVEQKWQENGQKPLNFQQILEIFLVTERGDLRQALRKAALFLRQKARKQNLKEDEKEEFTFQEKQWFVDHILDQYSPQVSFNSLPVKEHQYIEAYLRENTLFEKIANRFTGKPSFNHRAINFNYHLENRIGQPYHTFHLLSLLSEADPAVIRLLTFGEYGVHGVEQGSVKMLSDVLLLKELKKILKEFEGIRE